MEDKTFGTVEMGARKAVFMGELEALKVEGYVYVGRTKKGHVFEEVATGAFVELTAVEKKDTFDFGEAEGEYLDAVEEREAKATLAEQKRVAREAKKAQAEADAE
jgi:hypothetical protein